MLTQDFEWFCTNEEVNSDLLKIKNIQWISLKP